MPLPSQAVSFNLDSREIQVHPLPLFKISPANPREIYWIHFDSLDPDQMAGAIAELKIPEELVQQLRDPEAFPDVIETEDSLTISLNNWEPTTEEGKEPRKPCRLLLHLTDRYCLTAASGPVPAIERFASTYRREFRFAETSGFILFLILDNMIDDFTRSLRSLTNASELIDEQIQEDFTDRLSRRILDLKRQVITFHHFVLSLRDTLMRISGRKIAVVSESCRTSLAELTGHAQILVNQLGSLRELANNSLEAYHMNLNLGMNRTMKVLTIFTSITLPMSLIAGIYGMNFDRMPELGWPFGYFFALGLMTACGIGLLIAFKKKGLL